MSNLTNSPNSAEITGWTSGGDNSDLQRHTDHHRHPAAAMRTTSSGQQQPAAAKRKRNFPGTPDPDAEVIALSPRTLLATNRFVCEICNKGFQRDQNLQLHRRGHNLPWKLRQRAGPGKEAPLRKRVYVCPELGCVHHHPSRALGDLTGIKKHFYRKHGEKKWKCDKCDKRYAVQSDWKAHLKTCGTRKYRCDCGIHFSRRDSFITHRAFCDALTEESLRVPAPRQGDQSGGGPHNGLSGGMAVTATGVPSSPYGTNCQLSRTPTDAVPSFSEVSKPRMPDFPSTESSIASLSSKRVHGASSLARPSKPSSLWLGPGPPGAALTMQEGPSSTGINEFGNVGVISGSSELHIDDAMRPHKFPNGVVPLSSSRSAGDIMLANLFASVNNGYSGSQGSGVSGGQNTRNAMAGMSRLPEVMNHLDRGRFDSSFGVGNLPSTSSMLNQQRHTAMAQLSATALLQKAAQMGTTVSTPSLFRGFGMGRGDSSLMAQVGGGASARQDQKSSGITSIFSSEAMPSYLLMRQIGDHLSNSQGTRNSLGSSSILGQDRCNEGSGVHESIDTLSGGAGLFVGGLGNPSSSHRSSNHGHGKRSISQHADILLKQHLMGERAQDAQTSMLHGRSPFQLGTFRGGSSLGEPESGEDGGGKTTHDFLGVGGISRMAGANTGMVRTPTQKDLDTITSGSSGVCRERFPYQKKDLKTLGSRGQSPEAKSRDRSSVDLLISFGQRGKELDG